MRTSIMSILVLLLLVFKLSHEQNMNVTCSSHWVIDQQSFTTDVKWEVFDNVDINTIIEFHVTFRQYNEDFDLLYQRTFDSPIIENIYSYSLTEYGIVPHTFYEQETGGLLNKVIRGAYNFQISSKVPDAPFVSGECLFPLSPTEPTQVRDTQLTSSTIDTFTPPSSDRMVVIVSHMELQWSPPTDSVVTNVSALGYEVWIGTDMYDTSSGYTYDVVNVITMNESTFSGEVTKKTNIRPLDVLPSTKYIYVQLRCFYEVVTLDNGTHRIYSNWSGPVPMSVVTTSEADISTTSSTIVRTTTSDMRQHTQGSNSYSTLTHATSTTIMSSSINTGPTAINTSNGTNNGAIYLSLGLVMLVMLIIIVMVSIFAVVVCLKRRKKFKVLSRELESEASFHEDLSIFKGGSQPHLLPVVPPAVTIATAISKSNSPIPQPYLLDGADEWELPKSTVILHEKLGGGCFGMVYRGEVNGFRNPHLEAYESRRASAGRYVAIKLLKNNASNQEKNEFLEEIELMKSIAQGHHPHVVNMLGAVTRQEPMCVVTEYLEYGDLLGYLKKCRANLITDNVPSVDNTVYVFDHEILPESVDLVSFAYQIASGMEYLSSMKIIHRDLACRNVLVGEGNHIKISDFGLSRNMTYDSAYVKTSSGPLPIRWMAIESIMYHEFTTASDVWSFGITLWEIGTLGAIPYSNIDNRDILHSLKTGQRVDKPRAVSDEVYEIMLKCFTDNPAHRPTFTELKKNFDAILSKEKNTHDMYLDLLGENEIMKARAESIAASVMSPLSAMSHRSSPSVVTTPTSVAGTPTQYPNNTCSPHYSSIQDN